MDLRGLCRRITAGAPDAIRHGTDWYADLDPEVRESVSAFPGVKSDLLIGPQGFRRDELRIAIILSDLVSVFLGPVSSFRMTAILGKPKPPWPTECVVRAEWFRPGGFLSDVVINEGIPALRPAFIYGTGDDTLRFVEEIQPLANSGRLMARPIPVAFAERRSRTYAFLQAEPHFPGPSWSLLPSYTHPSYRKAPLRIETTEGQANRHAVASFTMPYLRDVSFADLGKILDDESHLVAGFRTAIRELIDGAYSNPDSSKDLFNDVVRPATDAIERKFRSIERIHALRIAGVTAASVLISLNVGSYEIPAWIGQATGTAGGIGYTLHKYSECLADRDALKEMPYYLLWRIRRNPTG